MPLFARTLAAVALCSCGVSNPTYLPPPDGTLPPYPTFPGPEYSQVHDAIGLPSCPGTLLAREYFVTCHDDDWLIPRWVGYVLTPTHPGTAERTDNFRADPDLPSNQRAEPSDYDEPVYDRGHMAPAGDFTRNRDAMSSTFVLSNIAPQHPELNQGEWAYLEIGVRNRVSYSAAAWIFTGNLMLDANGNPTAPQTHIGGNDVAVPTHCFKAVLFQNPDDTLRMAGHLLPNRSSNIGRWYNSSVEVDELEMLTGLDFFEALPDEVEAEMESLNWSL